MTLLRHWPLAVGALLPLCAIVELAGNAWTAGLIPPADGFAGPRAVVEREFRDGDLVVVRQQSTAEDVDIVVALMEDEATVKRLRRHGDKVVLQPENAAMMPIEWAPEKVHIRGKVVAVERFVDEK